MVNILFISNDAKINGLIAYLQPLLKTAINSIADFDQGLKDVFDKRPALVFIQRKIGGVSGEAVAQHIRELLRTNRPKIILLQDECENVHLRECYDDSIGFVLPEPDIYKVFHKYLQNFPEIPWRDQEPAGTSERSNHGETHVVKEAGDAFVAKKAPLQKETPKQASVSVATSPVPSPASAEPEMDFMEGIPFSLSPVRPRPWKRWAAIGGGLAVAACTWVIFTLIPVAVSSKQTAVAGGSHVAEQVPGEIHLPAAVVANPSDAAFAVENPGWQKYAGPRVDFRVFRDKGRIQVIQSIVHGEPMNDEFINAFLHDVFGKTECRITSTVSKDGFLIQRGVAPWNSEMIVYRQEKTNGIKGFVLSFS